MISRLLVFIKRILRLYYLPFKYRNYLMEGWYKYNDSATVLCNSRDKAFVKEETRLNFTSSHRNKLLSLITRMTVVYIGGKKKIFNANYLVVTSSLKDIKFFDIESRHIITVFSDKNRYCQILSNRNLWASHFNCVPFTSNSQLLGIDEVYIKRISYNSSTIYERVLKDYSKYFEECKPNRNRNYTNNEERIMHFCDTFRVNDYKSELLKIDTQLFNKTVLTHGDLWHSNIIYDGVAHYYIDFENIKERVFIYDLYMYIFADWFYHDDKELTENYYTGKYDESLNYLFGLFNTSFKSNLRKTYMVYFIYLMYYEKWYGKQEDVVRDKVITYISNLY